MAESKAVQVSNVADRVLQRYRDDVFERMRVLYKFEPRPFQWEWWFEMDRNPDVLGYSCKRVGKSQIVALKNLDEKLMHPYEDEMIFAPKYDQATNVFKYQYDIVYDNPIIRAYVARTAQGKEDFGIGHVNFYNRSNSQCFGVTSNFESYNASILWVDELDDVPPDTLKRVFGRGLAKNKSGLPTRFRFTGVIWGKLNIWKYKERGDFYLLPPVNVYEGLVNGWLEEKVIKKEREEMSDEEWLRTMCLQFVETRNFIWASKLKFSQFIGLKWNLTPVTPEKKHTYPKQKGEKISFGLDMGHQGSGEDASDYSLQVISSLGPYRRWIWGKTWEGTSDPDLIINEICDAWEYFRPDGGYGDALDANLIAHINDELFTRRVTYFNWRQLGENELEGWKQWAKRGLLTPLQNAGRIKHHFYNSLKKCVDNCISIKEGLPSGRVLIFPQIDRYKSKHLEGWRELQILIRELENLQSERSNAGYLKISRIRKRIDDEDLKIHTDSKLGDDRADALAMSNFFLDYLDSAKRGSGGSWVYIQGI